MYFNANYHQRGLIEKPLLFMTSNPVYRQISNCTNRKEFFLAMKMTTILLLSACLTASAGGIAQKVTLSQKNVKLEKVFREIRKQTGYVFFYDASVLRETSPVNIHVKDASVEEALKETLQGQNLDFSIERKTITIIRKPVTTKALVDIVPAVPLNIITGTVKDAQGNPLAGVSVIVKGTTNGTSTGTDGDFNIDANVGDVLDFTIVGYQKKSVTVGQSTNISVVMEIEAVAGSEIVIIGYGTVKKSDLTGSVSVVKASDISSAPVASVDQALQGKAAGVQVTSVNGAPGAPTTIRIRGGNSISASNEPLYVIDGFIGGGDLTSINPTDIASIEILKDASATAIYGARGANGVILITTKLGKAGKSTILINAYAGTQQLPKEVALLTGPELADYVNERSALFGTNPIYPDVSKVTNTDWQKAITRNAGFQNADISFSGGNDKITYYLSGNYFNQDGIILNSGFKRYQTRLNLNLKLTDWLSVGTNLNFNRSNKNNNKVSLYDILKSAPTSLPIKDSSGNYTIVSPLNGQSFENPVADAKMSLDNTYDNSLLGNWYAKASFRNELTFKSTFGINNDNSKRNQYQPGSLPLRSVQNLGGQANISSTQSLNILNENTISYDKDFGIHHVNFLGGFTYQHETDESYSAFGNGFTNDLLTYNNLATGDPLLARNGSNFSEWTIISFLGRINYSVGPYLLTISGRQDGSSRLAANHKYAFFPSAAFAWKLDEEKFIENLGWFSNLKIRLSYGKTGNQAIGVYSTLPSLSTNNAWFNSQQNIGYTLGNLSNSDLKWETTDQFNAGLDAGFFNGRLTATLDAYYKKTHDLLLTVQIPGTTGYSSKLENVGSVQNKGVELDLNGIIINKQNLSWNIGFNIAANRNKVLDLGKGIEYRDVTNGARLIVGQPAPVFWGAVYEGTFKSQAEIDALPGYQAGLKPGFAKFKDVNGNGKYDGTGDYAIIGNPTPKFFGGLNSSLRYERFSFNMYLAYTYGNDIINSFGPRLFLGEFASNVGKTVLQRWTPKNNQSNIPGVGANATADVNSQAYSYAVQDGSFLRLKTLQINYDLPVTKIKWMQGASIYLTGTNLFIIDHYTYGYDPEVNSQGTNSILRGFDDYSYPANRSFIIGVNLKF